MIRRGDGVVLNTLPVLEKDSEVAGRLAFCIIRENFDFMSEASNDIFFRFVSKAVEDCGL